jgi:antibiotic biosynthesis monooxygenase (ABM) superfamily enzyme
VILRLWHGWTRPENAEAYERLLKSEVFPGILAKAIPGFRGIELLRRPAGEEVEFVTLMRFDALENVKAFVGEDHEVAYVPAAARKLLARFDERAQHYELKEARQP